MLGISNFWESTQKLLVEHLWSPEQWLGTADLEYENVAICFEAATFRKSFNELYFKGFCVRNSQRKNWTIVWYWNTSWSALLNKTGVSVGISCQEYLTLDVYGCHFNRWNLTMGKECLHNRKEIEEKLEHIRSKFWILGLILMLRRFMYVSIFCVSLLSSCSDRDWYVNPDS